MPVHLGRIQHALNAAAQPPGRLGDPLPYRLQHRLYIGRRNLVDGHVTQGLGVLLKRNRRDDALERRRELMRQWGEFCLSTTPPYVFSSLSFFLPS
jgi:hypothetical protein